MSNRPLIAVDVDGVLYHWERTARYMLRRKRRRDNLAIPSALDFPSTGWDMIEELVSEADWDWLWSEGIEQGLFRYGHVVGGSLEGIEALHDFADLVIVTSRPEQAVNDTLAWLSLMLDKVDLTGIHILSHGQAKSTVQPLPDLLIDDGPHNMRDWTANTDSPFVLFSQPWNEHVDARGQATRAHGWPETVEVARAVLTQTWDERQREIV